MDTLNADVVRQQLQERREKLQEAIPRTEKNDQLRDLLKEVDTALEKRSEEHTSELQSQR